MNNLTSIGRIGVVKYSDEEFSTIAKHFTLLNKPDFAVIRIDSVGVCGIFINGEFLEAVTGRYANRVGAFECTSLLKEGENTIELKLGNHYYQPVGKQIFNRSGRSFSSVAAELTISVENEITIVTNKDWQCDNAPLSLFSEVTKAEYERFWLSAALWEEQKPLKIHPEILNVIDEDYITSPEKYVTIDNAIEEAYEYTVFDLGKLYVGYLEIECDAQSDTDIKLLFDYTENTVDFNNGNPLVERLSLVRSIKKGKNTLFILHRRAFRYFKLQHGGSVSFSSIKLRLSTKTYSAEGYFTSEDQMLNKIWQVGRYTLLVNKHQEYESCPRNEMKYFSGDAIIEALVDYYAFGDCSLVDASLSLTEIESNLGLRHNTLDRNVSLWDYPAWRILTAYNQYKYFNDTDIVKKYFDELTLNLLWMIDKMNSRYLIYQYPCFSAPMYQGSSPLEYNSSTDRLGEKPLLNALLYKCLLCMSEIASLLGDSRAKEWTQLAEKVKCAINEHLWCEEKGAYLDIFDKSYIPQDGNALCVLFGISDKSRTEKILKTVKKENWTPYGASMINSDTMTIRDEYRTISPVMNMYEAEARFLNNDEQNALELMRLCWGGMIKKGAETFWEFIPNDETEKWDIPSHGWASGCCYLFGAYVLGIRPNKSGYEEVLFAPGKTLDNYKGVVPTLKGLIAVKKENGKYTIAIPKNVKLITEVKNVEVIEY